MSTPRMPLHTKWPVAVVMGVLGSLVVALVVLAFLWPTKTATAQNLPVSVAGPDAAVTAFEKAIDEKSPGTFDFVDASSRDDAVNQIETRQTYGGFVLSATSTPEVLTAPAASTSATQILTGIGTQLQAQLAQQVAAAGGDASAVKVTVTPVVPLSSSDPNGTGLAAASFPLTMGGMIGGVLISLLVIGVVRRLVALAAFGVATGLVLALVLQTWFNYLQGNFATNALVLGLSITAISGFIVGCTSLIGRAGIAIGAVLTMFIANPLSAASVPWQFIAQPWGAIGQFMVPGAANWLIRSESYFPDAPTAQQWLTISAWLVLGVVLALIGHYRARATMHVPPATLDEEAALTASA